jgi:hypothetical protein
MKPDYEFWIVRNDSFVELGVGQPVSDEMISKATLRVNNDVIEFGEMSPRAVVFGVFAMLMAEVRNARPRPERRHRTFH